jgi:hypothetical protein
MMAGRNCMALASRAIAFVLCLAGLPACQDAQPGNRAPVRVQKTVSAELTGYNHTDKTIGAFYVNGQWGGNITPGSGGGKFVCCVELPDPWQPEMTVRVKWEDHDGLMHERDVALPAYDPRKAGGLNVHFLRSGQIKAFAGMTYLGHPSYPLKGEEAQLKPGVPLDIHD